MEVLKRFELVGGRIRLLLHNQVGFSRLKEQVLKSVYTVSAENLKQLDSLDLQYQAPSIIYSFAPKEGSTDPREYRLLFASSYISKHVASRIILHFRGQVDRLFAALKDQKVGGTLIGQIFEHLVLEALQSHKIDSFIGRSLQVDTEEESTININLNDFDVRNYTISAAGSLPDISTLITDNLNINRLLLPIQLNAPSVDAVFYNSQTRRLYFIQITISLNHTFNYLQVTRLANALGITDHRRIDFVYLVPQNVYHQFRRQRVENPPARNNYSFHQYVFRVPDIENASLSILDYVASH